MNADLHCHSTVSDGTLEPEVLAARAKANGVELWALTDHDELGGSSARASGAGGRAAVPERRRDLGHLPRQDGARRRPRQRQRTTLPCCKARRDARRRGARAREMPGARQGRHPGHLRGSAALRRQPGAHLAHALRAPPGRERRLRRPPRGFRRFLIEGKPGFVPHRWARLATPCAGSAAPAASPSSPSARYKFSPTEGTRLSPSSKGHGGRGSRGHDRQPHRSRGRPLRRPPRASSISSVVRQRLPQPRREPRRSRRPAAAADRLDAGLGRARRAHRRAAGLEHRNAQAPTIGAWRSISRSTRSIRSRDC